MSRRFRSTNAPRSDHGDGQFSPRLPAPTVAPVVTPVALLVSVLLAALAGFDFLLRGALSALALEFVWHAARWAFLVIGAALIGRALIGLAFRRRA